MAVEHNGLIFERLGHASVRIETSDGQVVYIDPWSQVLNGEPHDADIVFTTHDDSDHYDPATGRERHGSTFESRRRERIIRYVSKTSQHSRFYCPTIRVCGMLKRKLRKRVWLYRGKKSLSYGDCEATFNVESGSDAHSINHFIREESGIVSDLLSNLRPNDVFWDVGANMGIYSCLAADRGAEVHAFEPFPPNVERLEANTRLNSGGVNIHKMVLSDEDGVTKFAAPEVDPTGSGSVTIGIGSDTPTTKIESVRADTLVQSEDVPIPNVMKIDVEGSEQLVLEGARELLESDALRLLYVEAHHGTADHRESLESFGGSEDGLRTILTNAGFSIEEVASSLNETFLRCMK